MTIPPSFEQVTNNSPDGAQMGRSATEKNAFYGNTPVTQPTSANQAAVSATAAAASLTIETLTESSGQGTPNTTIVDVTGGVTDNTGSGLDAGAKTEIDALFVLCDDNFADLADQQSRTRVDLAAQKVELDKLITDVANTQTLCNQLRAEVVTLGLIKGS